MAKISKKEYEILKSLGGRWKWIARDMKETVLSDTLWIYEYVPERAQSYWMESWGEYKELPYHLFRFVQWVDSEPYRIAELIEEYESEETELNKQKLIEKWEAAIESAEFYGRGREDRLIEYMRVFVSDLRQVDDLQNLLVPKQEEMKVSKMWHDVIVQNKEDGHSLRWTLNYIDNLNVNDVDSFAKAWIAYPNIEVEEEQKYYVLNTEGETMIRKNDSGVRTSWGFKIRNGFNGENYKFTEQEIKDYDPRYWPFRKPVEEVEEC